MTPNSERAIERLLRETSVNDAPTGDCLDAETIAAWADGSLSGNTLEATERHVASCGRCQAMTAALIRSLPVSAAREHPGWRGWRFRWLVPVSAVLVIGLSFAIFRVGRGRLPASIEEAPEGSATAFEALQSAVTSQPSPPQERAASRPSQERSAGPRRDEAGNEARLEKAEPRAEQAPAAPPPAALLEASPPAVARETRNADQTADALGRVQSMRETVAPSLEIASPDGRARWRISAPGSVEKSTDQGANWETQSTGTSVAITAGSSPSPLVCWLVGRSGTVLLSADGKTWQPLRFPATVDLVGVQATDARTAVVTTADGRRFRTADAGISWQ